MRTLTKTNLNELLQQREGPCISIYQPTHRHHPDNGQDAIRFKNLLKEVEASMLKQHSRELVAELMEPLHVLAGNTEFWNHTTEGLAVFSARGFFETFHLLRPTTEIAIVSESFHVKPVKKYLQSTDRFQILCLSRDAIKMYEGNRDFIEEITLHEAVPTTVEQALGSDLTEEHITVASYNGPKGATPNMYHGHGSKKDEVDVDTERFFRVIDRAIMEHHSQPSEEPLILAALSEYHNLFNEISHNPLLIKENGIKVNPFAVSKEKLRESAWSIMEPRYTAAMEKSIEDFQLAKSRLLGSDNLHEVAKAAAEGRVAILLLGEDKIIPGQIIDESGKLKQSKIDNPDTDDVLDDLGELVVKMGGKVMVVPQEKLPDSGLAAIFRY